MFAISSVVKGMKNIMDNDVVDYPTFDLQNSATAQNQQI
jgi:hypothetical protein